MASATSNIANAGAVVTHINTTVGTVNWIDAQTDILLEYNSINQEPIDAVTLADAYNYSITKVASDAITISESLDLGMVKNAVDSVSFADAAAISMHWGVAIYESVSAVDTTVSEYVDGPIFNDVLFNAESFLARPMTVPNIVVTLI